MKISKNGNILQIEEARIIFRNFSGAPSKYNREGDRNFAVIIPDEEIKDELIADGWNVKVKAPREEGDTPFMYLSIKVKFNGRGPDVYVVAGNRVTKLDEESIGMLDDIEISNVDLDVRPYQWEVNGKTGRSAYLQAMRVVQNIDRFGEEFKEQNIEVR